MDIKITGPYTPTRGSQHAAGLDLRAFFTSENNGDDIRGVILAPGQRYLVPTGIRIEIPEGYEGQIRPRSGLANKYGITVLNAPGTIDSDFRGEIHVILINHGEHDYTINHFDKIAQLVIAKYEPDINLINLTHEELLSETQRGSSGFGSSGMR